MPPTPLELEPILHLLEVTRSVRETARRLAIPEAEIQRVAWTAFGLGRLDVDLTDF